MLSSQREQTATRTHCMPEVGNADHSRRRPMVAPAAAMADRTCRPRRLLEWLFHFGSSRSVGVGSKGRCGSTSVLRILGEQSFERLRSDGSPTSAKAEIYL